jgi:hypothetical protein
MRQSGRKTQKGAGDRKQRKHLLTVYREKAQILSPLQGSEFLFAFFPSKCACHLHKRNGAY